MRLTAGELVTQRTRPTQTRLDLFVFQPRVVMQCLVNNASIAKGARTIVFDTITLGSYLDVEPGMTLLVGSVSGASDLGRIRIRSAIVNTFTVSENSNIRWADNIHLTVLRYFELWPIFPRIIQNPASPTSVIFYKDYDIAYSNQNTILGTFINAGPHRPVLLESSTGFTGTVDYSSSGTLNLVGDTLSYAWTFEGGTPTGSTSANPGIVRYAVPGDYVTRLIVTSGSGAVDTTYRYVSVKNKIGEGTITPTLRWEMTNLSGSRSEGGYTAEFKVYDITPIEENAVVMLRSDDWYGSNHTSIGGNYPNASNIFFVGYVESDSISYDYKHSYVTFRVSSLTAIMKKFTGFSASVESTGNPSTWFQLYDMDVRRGMYHYLRWHTTALSIADFKFVGTDYKIQFFDVDRTSLYNAINSIMESALHGSLSSDKQGVLWAEVDPTVYPNPTGTFVPVMNITSADWMSEPRIDETINDTVSYLEVGGVAYSGVITGTYGAFLSGAPGLTPSFSGNIEEFTGLSISGQSHLNQMSGHIWANKNQSFPSVSMEMANPIRNLDIAPQEVVSIKILPSDTVRNVNIDGLYIPTSISWGYKPQEGVLTSNAEFTGLVNGVPGDTVIIPDIADNFDTNLDFSFDFNLPPFPAINIPSLVITDPSAIDNVIILVATHGVFYTNDFSSNYPTWYPSNLGLTDTRKAGLTNIEVSATGKMYAQYGLYDGSNPGDPFGAGAGNVVLLFSSNPGGAWSTIFDASLNVGDPGFPFPRNYFITGFGIDRDADDEIVLIAGAIVTIGSDYVAFGWHGNSTSLAKTTTAPPAGIAFLSASWGSTYITKPVGITGWTATSPRATSIYSMNLDPVAANETQNLFIGIGAFGIHTRSKKSPNALISIGTSSISLNNGISWSGISGTFNVFNDITNQKYQSIITNADGTQIVEGQTTPTGLVYSNNTGATWNFNTYTGTVTSVWHFGDDVYGFAGLGKMYGLQGVSSTPTLFDKTGNLGNIITGSFQVEVIRSY